MGFLQTVVVSSALVGSVVWLFLLLAKPGQRLASTSHTPFARQAVARLWLYAVVWVPALVLGAAFLPGIWALLMQQFDHCSAHGGPHGHHLCVVHPPHAATEPATWIVAGALVAACVGFVATFATRVNREFRLARALVSLSQPTAWGDDVRLLDGPEPVACTVGDGRSTILLSRGLVEQLTPKQLNIVLAHERAHVQRLDILTSLADRLVCAVLPSGVSRALMGRIVLAREQVCDAASARAVGSPLDVAAAILAVARLGVHRPCAGHCFGDGELEARIHYLLTPPTSSNRWLMTASVVMLAIVMLGAGPLHVAIEALTTVILH